MDPFDLDSILEQTLHEFDEQEEQYLNSSSNRPSNQSNTSNSQPNTTSDTLNTAEKSIISSMSPDREPSSTSQDATTTSDDDIQGMFEKLTQHFVEGIKQPIEGQDNEDDIKEDDDKYDDIMSTVMQQLLNKDMMYEPTRSICDKFPAWIEENRSKISEDELAKYNSMFGCFQRIIAEYELDVPDFTRLTDLMFEVQQYGQPPAEIIQGVAPGLMFDPSGLPSFNSKPTAPMPSSEAGHKQAKTDSDSHDGDDELPELPPGFDVEVARKIASGDCPTM